MDVVVVEVDVEVELDVDVVDVDVDVDEELLLVAPPEPDELLDELPVEEPCCTVELPHAAATPPIKSQRRREDGLRILA